MRSWTTSVECMETVSGFYWISAVCVTVYVIAVRTSRRDHLGSMCAIVLQELLRRLREDVSRKSYVCGVSGSHEPSDAGK